MSLFIGNLHPDCTEAILYRKFSPAGKILNIHICRKQESRQSLGYGYINFEDMQDAAKVINTMNYDCIEGQPIRIMWAKTKKVKFNPAANIFIKNLHPIIDGDRLEQIFSSSGKKILSTKVVSDKNGISKGVGYVQFETEEEADAAILEVNTKLVMGLEVTVSKYLSKNKLKGSYNNIYLKPLPLEFEDKDLVERCKQFGNILSAKVMKTEDGQSRGFGFVCFECTDSAKNAVEKLNGTFLEENGKRLYVGRALSKTERQDEIIRKFKQKLQIGDLDCSF